MIFLNEYELLDEDYHKRECNEDDNLTFEDVLLWYEANNPLRQMEEVTTMVAENTINERECNENLGFENVIPWYDANTPHQKLEVTTTVPAGNAIYQRKCNEDDNLGFEYALPCYYANTPHWQVQVATTVLENTTIHERECNGDGNVRLQDALPWYDANTPHWQMEMTTTVPGNTIHERECNGDGNLRFQDILSCYDVNTPHWQMEMKTTMPENTIYERECNEDGNLRFQDDALPWYEVNIPHQQVDVITMVPENTIHNNKSFEDVNKIEASRFSQLRSLEKRPTTNENSDRKGKKKVDHWTKEEHWRFIEGIEKCGKGNWKEIARDFVRTKSLTQVTSHAQKYYKRQNQNKKIRSSIMDITTTVGSNIPSSQQHETTINGMKPILFNDSSIMMMSFQQYEPMASQVLEETTFDGKSSKPFGFYDAFK